MARSLRLAILVIPAVVGCHSDSEVLYPVAGKITLDDQPFPPATTPVLFKPDAVRGNTSRVEPSILIRAVAIISVVLNHTGIFDAHFNIDGAAFLLLIPAGYSFARFQLRRVLETGRSGLALTGLPRIIVPTALILLLQQLRHREFDPAPLLLFNNFLHAPGQVFSYWFIEVFVQMHLLVALALSSGRVRSWIGRHAYRTSVIAVLGVALLGSVLMPLLWNTADLGNLLPQFALWYFLLGWCLLFAQRPWQRWLNTAMILGLPMLLLPGTSRGVWIMLGGLVMNWAPPLNLPTRLARGISMLASASLYIYISHFVLLEPFAAAFPQTGFIGQVVASLLFGVLFWLGFERLWQLGQKALARPVEVVVPSSIVSQPPGE